MKSRNVQAPYPAPATARYNFKTDHIGADLRSSMQAKPRARRRPDPLAGIWDSEVVPILKAAPDIRPYVVFGEISRRHPEIGLGICRTLERRIRRWQELNDPGPDATFLLRPSPDQWFLTPRLVANFLKSAHQGTLKLPDLPAQTRTHPSISGIIKYCKSGTLQKRSKALLALAVICNIPLRYLASYPISSKPSLYR